MAERISVINSMDEVMLVLPLKTRIYCLEEPGLEGTIERYEFHVEGKMSPLPYLVDWDNKELAREVFGFITCYPPLDQIAPLDEKEVK